MSANLFFFSLCLFDEKLHFPCVYRKFNFAALSRTSEIFFFFLINDHLSIFVRETNEVPSIFGADFVRQIAEIAKHSPLPRWWYSVSVFRPCWLSPFLLRMGGWMEKCNKISLKWRVKFVDMNLFWRVAARIRMQKHKKAFSYLVILRFSVLKQWSRLFGNWFILRSNGVINKLLIN